MQTVKMDAEYIEKLIGKKMYIKYISEFQMTLEVDGPEEGLIIIVPEVINDGRAAMFRFDKEVIPEDENLLDIMAMNLRSQQDFKIKRALRKEIESQKTAYDKLWGIAQKQRDHIKAIGNRPIMDCDKFVSSCMCDSCIQYREENKGE